MKGCLLFFWNHSWDTLGQERRTNYIHTSRLLSELHRCLSLMSNYKTTATLCPLDKTKTLAVDKMIAEMGDFLIWSG